MVLTRHRLGSATALNWYPRDTPGVVLGTRTVRLGRSYDLVHNDDAAGDINITDMCKTCARSGSLCGRMGIVATRSQRFSCLPYCDTRVLRKSGPIPILKRFSVAAHTLRLAREAVDRRSARASPDQFPEGDFDGRLAANTRQIQSVPL